MRSEEEYDTGKMNSKVFLIMFYTLLFMAMLGLCGCGGGGGGTSNPSTAKILASIVVQPADNKMAAKETKQFTILRTYTDGTTDTDLSAAVTSWVSSDKKVATINTAGMATAIAAGQTTITGTVDGVPYTATLYVSPTTLIEIAITPSTQTKAIGFAQQFTATGKYSDGNFQDLTETASWSSATKDVATIDAFGMATAVGPGLTTITAKSDNISGTATLTVSPASVTLASIVVTPENPALVEGTSQQFSATGTFSNSATPQPLADDQVTWSLSDNSIASITPKGKITALKEGTTTITAAFGGKSGTTVLNVTAATLQSIAVTPTSPTIAAGSTQQLSATGKFSNSATQPLTDQVTWSSSDDLIARITPEGKITALKEGKTTIIASFGGKSGSQLLTVTNAVLSGTWDGTYLIYDAFDKSQLGTYSFKMVLDQSGANVTGIASLRYKDDGQVRADGTLTVESVIVGREITLVFTYIDTRYSREMVDRGTATITDASMHGVVIENYNGGYNCSYSFDLKKL